MTTTNEINKRNLDVSGFYKVENIPEKNETIKLIEKYIYSKEDVDLVELYQLRGNDGSFSSGFYVTDGSIFDEIVKDHCEQDDKERNKKLSELKTKYPLLTQNKKTKRLILDPIEKMFIWDVRIHRQLIKSLSEKSIFCDTSEMRDMNKFHEGYSEALNRNVPHPLAVISELSIYTNHENNLNASEMFICNSKVKEANDLSTLINTTDVEKKIGSIEVLNNKLNFFIPTDFYSAKIPFSNEYTYGKLEAFEERSVKCDNGQYSIVLYIDELFRENLLKLEKFEKEIKVFQDEYSQAETQLDKHYNYERDGSDYYEDEITKLSDKLDNSVIKTRINYPIKDMGNYFFHVYLKK